jgi:hypothetical protein
MPEQCDSDSDCVEFIKEEQIAIPNDDKSKTARADTSERNVSGSAEHSQICGPAVARVKSSEAPRLVNLSLESSAHKLVSTNSYQVHLPLGHGGSSKDSDCCGQLHRTNHAQKDSTIETACVEHETPSISSNESESRIERQSGSTGTKLVEEHERLTKSEGYADRSPISGLDPIGHHQPGLPGGSDPASAHGRQHRCSSGTDIPSPNLQLDLDDEVEFIREELPQINSTANNGYCVSSNKSGFKQLNHAPPKENASRSPDSDQHHAGTSKNSDRSSDHSYTLSSKNSQLPHSIEDDPDVLFVREELSTTASTEKRANSFRSNVPALPAAQLPRDACSHMRYSKQFTGDDNELPLVHSRATALIENRNASQQDGGALQQALDAGDGARASTAPAEPVSATSAPDVAARSPPAVAPMLRDDEAHTRTGSSDDPAPTSLAAAASQCSRGAGEGASESARGDGDESENEWITITDSDSPAEAGLCSEDAATEGRRPVRSRVLKRICMGLGLDWTADACDWTDLGRQEVEKDGRCVRRSRRRSSRCPLCFGVLAGEGAIRTRRQLEPFSDAGAWPLAWLALLVRSQLTAACAGRTSSSPRPRWRPTWCVPCAPCLPCVPQPRARRCRVRQRSFIRLSLRCSEARAMHSGRSPVSSFLPLISCSSLLFVSSSSLPFVSSSSSLASVSSSSLPSLSSSFLAFVSSSSLPFVSSHLHQDRSVRLCRPVWAPLGRRGPDHDAAAGGYATRITQRTEYSVGLYTCTTSTSTRAPLHMYIYACTFVYACTYIHVHLYMYIYTCTFIHAHLCMYIYTCSSMY